MPRTRDAALVDQARAAAASGEPPAAIAARLGVHVRTVQRWLHGAGRPMGRPAHDGHDEQIVRLRDDGASWARISAETGLARSTARDRYAAATGTPAADPPGRPASTATARYAATLHRAGITVQQIAAQCRRDAGHVRGFLIAAGLAPPRARLPLPPAAWIAARYEAGESAWTLGREYHVATAVIEGIAEASGIPVRGVASAAANRQRRLGPAGRRQAAAARFGHRASRD